MTILTNEMKEAQYAAWGNYNFYLPCHETNNEPLVDINESISFANASPVERTANVGVDFGFDAAAPTSGSIARAVDITKGFIMLGMWKIFTDASAPKLAIGASAATEYIQIAGATFVMRTRAAGALAVANGGVSSANETILVAGVFDPADSSIKYYRDTDGGGAALLATTEIAADDLVNFTLANVAIISNEVFLQPTYGLASVNFNVLPETIITDMDDIRKNWLQGKSYLPESWENA